VDLRGKEAESVVGTTYQKPGGWWLTGADVFHQLHCLVSYFQKFETVRCATLNMLREGLHPDIYTHHDPEPEYTMHLGIYFFYSTGIRCDEELIFKQITV
jgi:hypothetical protein